MLSQFFALCCMSWTFWTKRTMLFNKTGRGSCSRCLFPPQWDVCLTVCACVDSVSLSDTWMHSHFRTWRNHLQLICSISFIDFAVLLNTVFQNGNPSFSSIISIWISTIFEFLHCWSLLSYAGRTVYGFKMSIWHRI